MKIAFILLMFCYGCGQQHVGTPISSVAYLKLGTIKELLRGKSLLELARTVPFVKYDREFMRWYTNVAAANDRVAVTNKILDAVANWQHAKALGHRVTHDVILGNNKKRIYSGVPSHILLYEFKPRKTLRVYHTYQDGAVLFVWGGTKQTQRKDIKKAVKILARGTSLIP